MAEDLVERIKAAIKHCRGTMVLTVVIDPEDEDKAAAIFNKLGKRAGHVTYRVDPNRKALLNANRPMSEAEWKKRLEEAAQRKKAKEAAAAVDVDVEAACKGDLAAAVTKTAKTPRVVQRGA